MSADDFCKWRKLTDEQIKKFRLSTYKGEVILINGHGPREYENLFYFNAQEFFTEEEIAGLPWYLDSESRMKAGEKAE